MLASGLSLKCGNGTIAAKEERDFRQIYIGGLTTKAPREDWKTLLLAALVGLRC